MADNFFVTAIIVTHDGATWLPEAIAAISRQTRQPDRIVAVDNGSTDASAKMLSSAGITVVKSDRESGFGDAIDLALAHSKPISNSLKGKAGNSSEVNNDEFNSEELLWILHDDIAPDRNALKFLIEGLADKPQVALVGPKLRGWNDRNQLLELGITIAVNGARWNGLEVGEQDQGQYEEQVEVLAVSTAAMLVRRSVYEDLGGLDPNLALFRDDVDFGWRVRVAGFSVLTAPKALAFHAEASANENRSVDVEEAFLHRPHLLDRRNAAYVLLANVSWWLIPWVAIQVVGAAAIRSLGYLIAKLPGYAGDEIAAVGYLLVKPGLLLRARKARKAKRLLSSRIIREFIPPPGSQIRLAWEKASTAVANRLKQDQSQDESDAPLSYSDIGVIDENFDEQDVITPSSKSKLATLRNRPLLAGLAFTFSVSLFASRHRLGLISGGSLAVTPSSAMELIRRFGESWHLVGLGSTAPTPPWVAITAVASMVTLGNPAVFISLLFLITPPLAFFAMYRALKRSGIQLGYSVIGGLLYAMSPVIWSSINQGRLGTIVLALVAPAFFSLNPFRAALGNASWRRVYTIALFAGFISCFSPLFLITWSSISLYFLGFEIYKRWSEISELGPVNFLMNAQIDRLKRFFAFLLIPGLLTAPWSLTLLLHPTQLLLDPGLPLNGGSLGGIFAFNPGGLSGVPIWIISPFILFFIVVALHQRYITEGAIAAGVFTLAILISRLHISGHGSLASVWTGSLILIIQILILTPVLRILIELVPNLRSSGLGFGHAITALAIVISIFSVITTTGWAITSGGNSLVASNKPDVVPAFISSLSETPTRPKTLVFGLMSEHMGYFITRGNDLQLGEPDVSVLAPAQVQGAIEDLIGGIGVNSSKVLGAYGIQYVFMKEPVDQGLVRTIDGIGGFTRSSATSAGIIWKVLASSPRAILTDSNGVVTALKSSSVGVTDTTVSPGTITLAEKYDGGWRLIVGGKLQKLSKSPIGLPTFTVNDVGNINLSYDGTKRRAFLSLELVTLLTVIVLALPAGRRRKEVVQARIDAINKGAK